MASEAGQLQLNAFEPIMGYAIHKSLKHLTQACKTLRVNCVEGIQANRALLAKRVAERLGIMSRAEMNALLVPERLTQPVRLHVV